MHPDGAHFDPVLGPLDLRSTPLLRTDVLVIGAGIAGGATALEAADAGASVLLVTKGVLSETNTAYAQGGIAAVLLEDDSNRHHTDDTIRVGAGLSVPAVADTIIPRSTETVAWLEKLGARFDAGPDGTLKLSREGGHSKARVIHANGDATGAELQRAISEAVRAHPGITVREHAFVRDLLVEDGHCAGAALELDGVVMAVEASAVVLAAGGAGQIYRETTNPIGATGDGIALAFRAGARMSDLEFVQFHPTTLYIAGASRFLISEVVRGAGATLRDRNGDRFMDGVHPMAELAPRDVVSRAILERMVATGDTHVYLDLSTVRGNAHELFPSISRICDAFDIDIARDPVPVRPGAHYFIGGATTDLMGRTSVPRLYAVGEASATGLHGANRLASNSLLEGAVMGRIAGREAAVEAQGSAPHRLPRQVHVPPGPENAPRIHHDDLLYSLKSLMWRQVGLKRSAEGLAEARERIGFWHHYLMRSEMRSPRAWELANMLTTSALVAAAATQREESRGTHFRIDHPERNDAEWCRRITLQRAEDGSIQTEIADSLAPTDAPADSSAGSSAGSSAESSAGSQG